MENIKKLRQEIKRLSCEQSILKLNRKTVNFPSNVKRIYDSSDAQSRICINKDIISVLLTTLSILTGKNISHIPKTSITQHKNWYARKVKENIEIYGNKE